MTKDQLKVGQKVYLKPIGNAARYSRDIEEVEITKLGNKYFYISKKQYGKQMRFDYESMVDDRGQYSSEYVAYLSLQEIEDEKELVNNRSVIANSRPNLEQSRRIVQILNENT